MIKAKTHHRCVIRFTDKILLIGILTTFLILVASNTPQSFAAEFFKLGGVTVDSVEQNNQVIDTTVTVVNETHFIEENITTSIPFTVKPETDLEIDYNIYKTRNGLEFGLGSVYNSGNEKNITVKIFNEDDEIYVNITMKKNGTWNFGKIKDMLIVPLASNLIINPLNTSYYESVNQLRISLNSTSNEDEFLVYTKQRPNRVVADVSTKWDYDYDTKILKISLLLSSEHSVIIDWTYYPFDRDVLFVEDTAIAEELNSKIAELENSNNNINNVIKNIESELSKSVNETKKLNSTLNETENIRKEVNFEITTTENNITELNKTDTELENKIKENVILSFLQIIFIALVFLIPISYILFFGVDKVIKLKKVNECE